MGVSDTWGSVQPTVSTAARVHAAWQGTGAAGRAGALLAVLASASLPLSWWVGRSFVRAVVDVTPWVVVGSGVAGAILAIAALVDLHEHRLPNVLLTWAMGSAAVGVGCHASIAADPARLLAMFVGLLLCGGVMFAVWCTRGIGMGDVKTAAVVGAAAAPLEVTAAPVALAAGAATAGLWGLVMRRRSLPLGPFLWFGWALAAYAAVFGWLR